MFFPPNKLELLYILILDSVLTKILRIYYLVLVRLFCCRAISIINRVPVAVHSRL